MLLEKAQKNVFVDFTPLHIYFIVSQSLLFFTICLEIFLPASAYSQVMFVTTGVVKVKQGQLDQLFAVVQLMICS